MKIEENKRKTEKSIAQNEILTFFDL